jgi:hypothetical protein
MVFVVDISSKRAIPITLFKQPIRKTNVQAGNYYGRVFIRRTNEKNLLVGYSTIPEIFVYSPEGEKIYSFKVNIKQIKVSKEMKEEFVNGWLEEARIKKKPFIKKLLKKMDPAETFPEYVPYYRNITLDPDGNVLVTKHNGFSNIEKLGFQVYSKEGRYICDSKINFGSFFPTAFPTMVFHGGNIFCLLKKQCDDDICIQLVKVKANEEIHKKD